MANRKEGRRVQRTRQLLENALIDLTVEKGYAKVLVCFKEWFQLPFRGEGQTRFTALDNVREAIGTAVFPFSSIAMRFRSVSLIWCQSKRQH